MGVGTRAAFLAVAFGFAGSLVFGLSGSRVLGFSDSEQKTVRDKVYTKEQAARGEELYVKHCERCHNPAKVPEGKKPGPPTIGAKFLETWADRTLGELYTTIFTTMPSDGTVTLSVEESLDSVAYLLKANGFPEGTTPLKNDDAMKAVVITR